MASPETYTPPEEDITPTKESVYARLKKMVSGMRHTETKNFDDSVQAAAKKAQLEGDARQQYIQHKAAATDLSTAESNLEYVKQVNEQNSAEINNRDQTITAMEADGELTSVQAEPFHDLHKDQRQRGDDFDEKSREKAVKTSQKKFDQQTQSDTEFYDDNQAELHDMAVEDAKKAGVEITLNQTPKK